MLGSFVHLQGIEDPRSLIHQSSYVKTFGGKELTGPYLVQLLKAAINVINQQHGSVVDMVTVWGAVLDYELEEAVAAAAKSYDTLAATLETKPLTCLFIQQAMAGLTLVTTVAGLTGYVA